MRQKLGLALATAMLWVGFGVGGRAEAAGLALSTPAGLTPGESFQFIFVTDGTTLSTSSDIADYNTFVNNQAGGATYNGTIIQWSAIGSTLTVSATANIGTNPDPVYLVSGVEVAKSTTTSSGGLWSGTLNNPINEDITGKAIASVVWTGTTPDGLPNDGAHLAGRVVFALSTIGDTTTSSSRWVDQGADTNTVGHPLYGISGVLTVVPEPSSLWMSGIALSAGLAYGWSRHRRDQRRQRPVGSPDATE